MKLIKIFIITFTLAFTTMVILDLPLVKQYIKSQIKQAKLINIMIKYNIKPQGLNG